MGGLSSIGKSITKAVKKAKGAIVGGGTGAILGSIIPGVGTMLGAAVGSYVGNSIDAQRQQIKTQEKLQAASEKAQANQLQATEYAAAVQKSVSGITSAAPMIQTAQVNSQLSARAEETARRRRYSLSNTINKGSLLGGYGGALLGSVSGEARLG